MTIFNTLSKATTTGLVALVLGTQPSQAIEPQAQSTYTQAQYESDLVYIQDQLDSKKTKQKTIPKSELMYTQKEFEKAFKKPRTNSTLLRKAELMHKNPKQTFNYLSKEQQKKVTRFCTSLQTSKDKGPFDDIIKHDHKTTYPFINIKKPTIADALIMYLHEEHLSKQKPLN